MAENSGRYIWKWSKNKIERKKNDKIKYPKSKCKKKNIGKVESAPNKRKYRT